jgi:hypothetical protein
MKATKNTIEAKILIETSKGYIYKSVTPYDDKFDNVEYSVSGKNGDEFGRFENLENALIVFNETFM